MKKYLHTIPFDTLTARYNWGAAAIVIEARLYSDNSWTVIARIDCYGTDGSQKMGWILERIEGGVSGMSVDACSKLREKYKNMKGIG